MIKYVFLTLAFVCLSLVGSTQTLDNFKQKLEQPDSVNSASIQVFEHGLGDAISTVSSSDEFNVYRVNIFFDNGQNARFKAQEAEAKFKELYPEIPSYLVYENPYFKITVGNCTSSQEAIIMLGKLRENFPKSFLAREMVKITTLLD